MIRTLRWYLGKDLAKATALSGIAFTLVMTVLAVIEPLRDRGLSSSQAFKLFVYSLPVMVSLTLPVAALFAAAFTYGRFSQDNELMACRASGISTLSLLGPAVWLGIIVSCATLLLGMFVAPHLLWRSQSSIRNNLEQIAFHGLKSRRHIDLGSRVFHADLVDPANKGLGGVVAIDFSDPSDVLVLAASKAALAFPNEGGRRTVALYPENPVVFRQRGGSVAMEDREGFKRSDLDAIIEEQPRLYDWRKLCQIYEDPGASALVQAEMGKIERQVCLHRFAEELVNNLRADGKYDKLVELAPAEGVVPRRVEVQCRQVELGSGEIRLGRFDTPAGASNPAVQGLPPPVVVRQFFNDVLEWQLRAQQAIISTGWDEQRGVPRVWLVLRYPRVEWSRAAGEIGGEQGSLPMGPFAVPEPILAQARGLSLDELMQNPQKFVESKAIQSMVNRLSKNTIRRLMLQVQAEMHLRLAYGISCLFMVMLGSVLGLLFRGGQTLTAFAISAGPTFLVVMMLFMGKELMRNSDVPHSLLYGGLAMWGGVGLLALATLYVYAVTVRR